jgi:hypothetical protein
MRAATPRAVYDARCEIFVEIYRQMKGVWRELNG